MLSVQGRAPPLRPASDLVEILELHLLAFGPFTDLRLDFSSPSPGLHVVYGPNEAGKSTALRAIRGLLYGIPHITPDAHLHHNTNLRVGGRLAGRGDAALALVRRKGRVKTLRDPDDNPLDDAALAPVLGGVTEELFRTSFGLTHETLRQGAEALLQGKGDVGQSLFGAGLGGPGLHQLLPTLRQEADEIFTPQARTRPLNEAIKAFEAARNGARSAAHPPADWTRKRQEIDEQRAEQERVDAELRALRSTDKRLRRALRVLPLLEARRAILGRRAALGHVVLLPESAQRDREDAQDRAADASAQASRLRADIAELEARHAALEVPASLADLDAGAIDGLVTRLGSHRKAAVDLPRVRAELHGVEEDARAILRRLGRDASLAGGDDPERLEAMRVDVATEARIKKLARERGAAEAKPREVERLLSAHRARRDACARRLAELPPGEDPAPLRGALSRAQKQGDLKHRLREAAAAAAQLARDADAQRDRLGLGAARGGRASTRAARPKAGRSPRPRRAPCPSRSPRRSTRRPRSGARSPGSASGSASAPPRSRRASARAPAKSTRSSAPAPSPRRPTSRRRASAGTPPSRRWCAPSRRRRAPARRPRQSTPPRSSTSARTRPPRPGGGAGRRSPRATSRRPPGGSPTTTPTWSAPPTPSPIGCAARPTGSPAWRGCSRTRRGPRRTRRSSPRSAPRWRAGPRRPRPRGSSCGGPRASPRAPPRRCAAGSAATRP